jgi:hypothetical protein
MGGNGSMLSGATQRLAPGWPRPEGGAQRVDAHSLLLHTCAWEVGSGVAARAPRRELQRIPRFALGGRRDGTHCRLVNCWIVAWRPAPRSLSCVIKLNRQQPARPPEYAAGWY